MEAFDACTPKEPGLSDDCQASPRCCCWFNGFERIVPLSSSREIAGIAASPVEPIVISG